MCVKRPVAVAGLLCALAASFYVMSVQWVFAQAQAGSGLIEGLCQDNTGAVLPGVRVSIVNVETGAERETITDDTGRFRAPLLPVGQYKLIAELPGFSKLERAGITLNVGASLNLTLTLRPATISETITVTEEAPILEPSRTEFSTTVNQIQIQNLPINGRRWENFALLTPGTTNDGNFGLVSYRGLAGVFNNNMVDGADNNQAFFSESRGRTRISYAYSQESIKEFQVGTSNFSAEFGRAAGGFVNAVTKSGTNELHGSAFYYLRDDAFLAQDPFAKARNQRKPDERRQQFGVSLGFPFIKDKLFFFGTYDQQVRNFPITVQPTGGRFFDSCPDAAAGCAAAKSFLNSLIGVFPRKADQSLFLTKVDWQMTPKHRLSGSYNFLNFRSPNGIQTAAVVAVPLSTNGRDGVRNDFLITTFTSVLSSNVVNEARFQYGRDFEFQTPNAPGPNVRIRPVGGLFQYGMPDFLPRLAFPNEKRFQWTDNFTYTQGKHTLKLGVDINLVRDLLINLFQGGGVYSYTGPNALRDFALDFVGVNTGASTRKHYSNFAQAFDTTNRGGKDAFYTTDYNVYLNDTVRVHTDVTLNLGVRYELQRLPAPRSVNPLVPQTGKINVDKNNVGPRVGVAWQPFGDKKTVVRTGYGVFYGRTENSTVFELRANNALLRRSFFLNRVPEILASGPAFPSVFPSIPTGIASPAPNVSVGSPNFVNPIIHQASLEIQRELFPNWSVSASYLLSRGQRLPIVIDRNLAPPTTNRTFTVCANPAPPCQPIHTVTVPFFTRRIQPEFTQIVSYETILNSWYNALVLQVSKRFSRGFQFSSWFTLSKTIDDGHTSFTFLPGTGVVFNPYNIRDDRGLSNFDQRKRFVFNGYWEPPFKGISNGVLRAALDGFKLSSIVTLSDGFPVTPTVSVGASLPGAVGGGLNGSGNTNNRVPFQGRNTFRRPGLANVDFRVAREIRIRERYRAEFMWEAFNLFNRVNYSAVETTAYALRGSELFPSESFLRPTAVFSFPSTGLPRQMQISLRFRF